MAAKLQAIWLDLAQTASKHAARVGQTRWRAAFGESGWWALAWFRLAQWLWDTDLRGLARWVSAWSRRATGIDLHPAARIGRGCLLLGPWIAVGEMSVIGDDCTLHAGVKLTAGGLTPYQLLRDDREPPPGRGHPTVGNRCHLEAGAIVQGDVFIGDDARLLSGAVVTRDVPDGAIAVGPACRIISEPGPRLDLDARAFQALSQRLQALEEQVQILNFASRRQAGGLRDTHNPPEYGPIQAVENLLSSAGLD